MLANKDLNLNMKGQHFTLTRTQTPYCTQSQILRNLCCVCVFSMTNAEIICNQIWAIFSLALVHSIEFISFGYYVGHTDYRQVSKMIFQSESL